ncbi:MAG: DNA polymerase III subunit delta' [Anaerolineae bacterium]|nr:DNA polymerase III subunit delta' [Anaerolineae bacterium]
MNETAPYHIPVFGHDWAIELLQRQVSADRVPHALLISGPPNVGKSTCARYFAQFLNCTGPQKPCGECLACRKIVHQNHADVRILDDDDQPIKIDQVRDIQRELSLSPYEGNYRVAIFNNFERTTTSAANALLKTLEEPASQVILILTAVDPGALLPTIVSRCQGLNLRALPVQQVSDVLQAHWQTAPEQAELLAQLSGGRLGWAVTALTDQAVLTRRESCLQDLLDLLRMSRVDRLAYARELGRNQALLKETLLVWLTIWRDLLLIHSNGQTKILNLDWQEQLRTLAGYGSLTQAKEMVEKLRAALINLDYNVNPRLNLETVLLRLPQYKF